MRGPLDLFPLNYNKLDSYNPIEDSQLNTQTLLRDLPIKAFEDGQTGKVREEERRGAETGTTDTSWSSLWDSGRVEESGCGVHSL